MSEDTTVPTVTISPAKDRRVRHESGALLEKRTDVEWSAYWQRRADDGDITIRQAEEPSPPSEPSKTGSADKKD